MGLGPRLLHTLAWPVADEVVLPKNDICLRSGRLVSTQNEIENKLYVKVKRWIETLFSTVTRTCSYYMYSSTVKENQIAYILACAVIQ